ncbi:2Fe-2S iron-sulfur cluster-binding protein [Algiphilus sp. W345]|uniref:2Fe-2S iron-sulfur cluster-binding protein n=1 Tax=Banduia mediterranea TaxID=3075609 RepID=A0ABU2WN16_9GAMM|nr:2Fe-2S iron-sulfur cluster-binding protein [Algiphilus sp. W345]MDT0499264.1 2Fe-2S iron-sulfur cluster-binding protein [Algiphilus sp. W345]
MIKIHFVDHGGTERSVEVEDGISLMEAATQNLIPGIDGDCGGSCACATCHMHIDPEWLDRLPPIEDQENQMLDIVDLRDADSRLGCQVKVSPELDGIVVRTPIGQH